MAENTQVGLVPLSDTDLVVAGDDADVRGRTVVDRNGDEIGEVDGLLVDTDEKRVRFLQIGSGGFLGIGERKQLVPVDAVTRVGDEEVTIDKDREHVAGAPVYDPQLEQARDRGYYEGLYGYYGYPPFWGPGYRYPRFPHY